MVYVIVLGIAFVSWYLGMRMGFKVGYATAMDHATIQLLSAIGGKVKVIPSGAPVANPEEMEDDSTKGGNA